MEFAPAGFIEYMLPFIRTLSQLFSLLFRQMEGVRTGLAAAAIIICRAGMALYKQQVAAFVFTIGVGISRLSALVAGGNNIGGDALPQAVIKYKVLTDEF